MLSVGKKAVFLKMKSVSKRQFSVRPDSTLGPCIIYSEF